MWTAAYLAIAALVLAIATARGALAQGLQEAVLYAAAAGFGVLARSSA